MTAQRHAHVVRLRRESREAYRRLHADPWPEVLELLRTAQITNFSIFLRGDLLFSYYEYEGGDLEFDLSMIAEHPVGAAWAALTDDCQRPLDDAPPGQLWAPAEELFHLD